MEEINVIPDNFVPQVEDYPFPCPFILSSVEMSWCSSIPQRSQIPQRIAFIKRRHLEENLKTFADEIGMDETERKKFLTYWCSPANKNHEMIRAELDECFNIRQRAEWWMERAKPKQKEQKSRIERYAESAQEFYNNNAKAETISPSTDRTQGFGYADIPDEQ